jgi:hypothetical protein
MKLSNAWLKNPTRTIHWAVSALVLIAAITGDLSNALNGTETWFGAAFAIGNVVQGEVNRSQVSPAKVPPNAPTSLP